LFWLEQPWIVWLTKRALGFALLLFYTVLLKFREREHWGGGRGGGFHKGECEGLFGLAQIDEEQRQKISASTPKIKGVKS
jgi:hypothetical protein